MRFNVYPVSSNPPTGNSTTTVEVAVVWEDLLGQNTESMQNTDGSGEMLWWGYDGKNNRFIGAVLGSDEDGNETYKETYDSQISLQNNTAPVTILDARAVRINRPATMNAEGGEGVTVFVMGLNASGNVVFHIPFGEMGVVSEFPKGSFFGLDESKISSKPLGFVKQQGNVDDYFTNTNNDYFLVWSALPNATKDKLNITLFPSYSAAEPVAVPTELDTGFEVLDTYVSQSSPSSIIVLAHGAQNARAMYRLTYELQTDPETGEETGSVTGQVRLDLPDNVDVRPAGCYTPKKDTPKQDGVWECKDPVLSCDTGGCGSTTHFRTLGRWPWNWRELLTPEGRSPLTRIVQADVSPGSDELMFSANSVEAFFIRRREVFGVSTLDVVARPYASPLSDLSAEVATYDIGDFNGDGIADLYVSTNFSMLTASAMLSADDVVCSGCLIYFGDGLGGYLETSMSVLGPSTEWSINDEIQASFGKGTKKSTTKATSRAELQ